MNRKRKEAIAYGFLTIVAILLFLRNFFSFTWSDESFYLTLVHRFWLGEKMIADEWFTAQTISPLLLPFYSLYQKITGGNEGVYFYFRTLYWCISTATCIYSYQVLKKYHQIENALAASLLYYLYSRANIGGMSYYNMTLTLTLLGCLLLYDQLMKESTSYGKCIIIGILWALAVVSTPYLSVVYLVAFFSAFCMKRGRKQWKSILCILFGSAVMAILYLRFLLSRTSISELLFNIPYILNEPELQKTNPLLVLPLMAARIGWRYKWTIVPYGIGVVVSLVSILRKNHTEKKKRIILLGNLLIFFGNVILSWGMIGCINIAYVLFIFLFWLSEVEGKWEKRDIQLLIFFIVGACLSLAFSFSSDTGLDAMSIGFVLLAMSSMLWFGKQKKEKIAWGLVSILLLETTVLRLFSVYRDAPIGELNTQLNRGPGKYLFTTEEHQHQYEKVLEDIEAYVRPEDRVLYSQSCFWSYLCGNNAYGTPSSWRMPLNSRRLEEYFTLYPEKIPTCVVVFHPEYGNFSSSLIQGNEVAKEPNFNFTEGFLYEYMMEQDYQIIQGKTAKIYRK